MSLEPIERVRTSEQVSPLFPITTTHGRDSADKKKDIELSAQMRAELLDLDAWGEILTTYGKTMRVAVALTDSDGHVLGKCHNPQPVWSLIHDAACDWTGCPFCITADMPCTAVEEEVWSGHETKLGLRTWQFRYYWATSIWGPSLRARCSIDMPTPYSSDA